MEQDNQDKQDNKTLEEEFAGMRKTISGLIKVIKRLDEQLDHLSERVDRLEALAETIFDPEEKLLARYKEGCKEYRVVRESPQRVALALHFIMKYTVPTSALVASGVLSLSRVQGLRSWPTQFAMDYCTVHNVTDILENGVTLNELKALLPSGGLDKLKNYLPDEYFIMLAR